MSHILRGCLISVVTLGMMQAGSEIVRAGVDVRSELRLAQEHSEASLRLWTAEANITRLRLEQLEKLRKLGHASWLEVAQSKVTLGQHLARQQLEQRMTTYLSQLSGTIATHSATRDAHAIRIVDPVSARLIGWFDTDAIVPPWAAQVPLDGDSPSRASINSDRRRAEASQLRVDRLIDAEYADDSVALRFARHERDRSAARADVARLTSHQAQSECDIHRVIDKHRTAQHSVTPYYANINTGRLTRATLDVIVVEAECDGQIRLAELICEKHRRHLTAIEQLHGDGHASQIELQSAQQAVADAQQQRDTLMRRRDYLAAQVADRPIEFRQSNRRDEYWQLMESLAIRHPTVLRHLIDLRRQRLAQLAACRGLESQLNLAEEIGVRWSAASHDESHERRSNALDQRILRARITSVRQLNSVLEQEELRFAQHLAPKLQGQGSEVPDWLTRAAGHSALGRLAWFGMVAYHADQLQRRIVYLDAIDLDAIHLGSHSVIDPVSLCLTCVDDSECCSTHEIVSRRLRSSSGRNDMSWRTASPAPTRLPRTALVSQYDLQRICSYYCDLPGSVCPQPNLGTRRLFSSYAVPVSSSRHRVRHDNWRGIRVVSYAISHTGMRKYRGLDFSGIPIYEPVIRRVRQSTGYRPSFRIP